MDKIISFIWLFFFICSNWWENSQSSRLSANFKLDELFNTNHKTKLNMCNHLTFIIQFSWYLTELKIWWITTTIISVLYFELAEKLNAFRHTKMSFLVVLLYLSIKFEISFTDTKRNLCSSLWKLFLKLMININSFVLQWYSYTFVWRIYSILISVL